MPTTIPPERGQPSRTSLSMSRPRPSGGATTICGSELSLSHLYDRINQLDSSLHQLRSTVLTKDGYVDCRNSENEHIRREFETLRATSDRLDLNVAQINSRLDLIDSRFDSMDSRLDTMDSRFDSMDSRFDSMDSRFDSMDSRMRYSDRVRFNSLAHTILAPISPVPVIANDGSSKWPEYFPRTVWKFWCLKKKSRVHRLVELAEFYQVGGYQDWSRMQQTDTLADSDSSDSSDGSPVVSREEAVRRFPEIAHQALAATLGLVYYKIRNEVGEGPNAVPIRPLKRQQENVASASPGWPKPVKMPRRLSVSDTFVQRLINGPSVAESQSSVSEDFDKLGWKPFSDVSEDAMSKLRSIDPQDIGTVLRALEQGRLKLKPSESEKAHMSSAGSKGSNARHGRLANSVGEGVGSTVPNTPSKAELASVSDIPETATDSDRATFELV
ncbi:hypothetical protein N7523_005890 [Penicillium sp. IBT 18751x]|nr:hypothetical protein N7523_005890 [Penicillium sp. IBT 18751x]